MSFLAHDLNKSFWFPSFISLSFFSVFISFSSTMSIKQKDGLEIDVDIDKDIFYFKEESRQQSLKMKILKSLA